MFLLTNKPIDIEQLSAQLNDHAAGAVNIFEGRVRNHNDGRAVQKLSYEAYLPLCESESQIILNEAASKFDCCQIVGAHRYGSLEIGDVAVWVGVSAAHRDHAFKACRYVIDEIKLRLPIWKNEFYADGETGWINCQGLCQKI